MCPTNPTRSKPSFFMLIYHSVAEFSALYKRISLQIDIAAKNYGEWCVWMMMMKKSEREEKVAMSAFQLEEKKIKRNFGFNLCKFIRFLCCEMVSRRKNWRNELQTHQEKLNWLH